MGEHFTLSQRMCCVVFEVLLPMAIIKGLIQLPLFLFFSLFLQKDDLVARIIAQTSLCCFDVLMESAF